MDSDKQVVSIGLDITAQEFAWALEDEALASYQKGYEQHRAEQRAKRIKVLKKATEFAGIMFAGFVVALLLMWARWGR